ncbi:hypothetical protein KBB08_00115 [Candidatus Gracilibacteria bacterium]|nr:hypothetical protein [Candidatus Gracilibacteria bacterium]
MDLRFADTGYHPLHNEVPTPAQVIAGGLAIAKAEGQSEEQHFAALAEIEDLFRSKFDTARSETRGGFADVISGRKPRVRSDSHPGTSSNSGSQAA